MGVVTGKMLHRYMSEPRWTSAQEQESDRHVAAVERELEGALYGATISPVEMVESVTVSPKGRVDTSLPVLAVRSLDGVELPDGTLPAGWVLRNHRLSVPTTPGFVAATVTTPWLGSIGYGSGYGAVPAASYEVPYVLRYQGGWGAEPALVEAILRKAARRMSGQHADTIVVTGLTAQPSGSPAASESPNFTEDDLRPLGRYRALGWDE